MDARTKNTPYHPAFKLGDSGNELRPLQRVMFVPDLTEEALRRAGIGRGMRILDLGCGTGAAWELEE